MGLATHEAINQFKALMDRGACSGNLERFSLKARKSGMLRKPIKMWRLQNGIDEHTSETHNSYLISTEELLDSHRVIGDLPVFAIGAGLSTFDKASIHYYVQSHIQINEYRDRVILPEATKKSGKYVGKCVKVLDMSGLKLSALNQIKMLTTISTVDDLNYPEKTITYYIVNVPYIFSACWKVVKPLLQERTKLKVRVLQGSGRDELLKIMDYSALPHFCRKEGSGSSSGSGSSRHTTDNCYSLDHPFHQELYSYMKQQSGIREPIEPAKQGSVHVSLPIGDPEDADLCRTLESELKKLRTQKSLVESLQNAKIKD
ncbi:phosphatidylinositol/phosphatidylcholine transfer protein SFH2 [Tanacetum coccineum]